MLVSTFGDDMMAEEGGSGAEELDHRALFRDFVASPEFYAAASADPGIFRNALIEASAHGWLHYSRLGLAMGLDQSIVRRWFQDCKKCTTPEFYRRRVAIEALKRIVTLDLQLLIANKKPIGHLSVKDWPELGFPPISAEIR